MRHYIITAVVFVCAFGVGIPADAQATTSTQVSGGTHTLVTSLEKRLDALTKMIDDLKKRIDGLKSGTTATTTTDGTRPLVCERIRTLGDYQKGMSGDGVRSVQSFLVGEGRLNGDSVTGYFGPTTERALKEWQSSFGVVAAGSINAGHGRFGTLTRNAFLKRCAQTEDGVQVGSFKLSPQSGAAPLTVEVASVSSDVLSKMKGCTYSVGRLGTSGNGLTVDWGDGTVSPEANPSGLGTSCTSEVKKHTYTKDGTYTVKVKSWKPGPTDAPETEWQGTARVVVGEKHATTSTSTKPISKHIRAALKARTALAEQLDARVSRITVTGVEMKEWTDGCLGLGGAAESCAAVVTPGYRVTLTHDGDTYYARTNKTGSVVSLEE